MAKNLTSWVSAPGAWLSLAGMLFTAAVLVGYHNDQIIADRVLSQRQGPVPLVAIQNFDATRHSNMTSEVRLLAEVDFGQVIGVNLGTTDKPDHAAVIPLYPLSDAGAAAVQREASAHITHRPIARAAVNRAPALPIGAVLSNVPIAAANNLDLERLMARRIGGGLHGMVVEISGVARPDHPGGNILSQVLYGSRGTEGFVPVVVEPFQLDRAAFPSAESDGWVQTLLMKFGLVTFLTAVMLAVRPPELQRPRRQFVRVVSTAASLQLSHHTQFQRIATQDELYDAEELGRLRPPNAIMRGASAVIRRWSVALSNQFKNRR